MVQTGTYEELLASSLSFSRLLNNIHQHEHPIETEYKHMNSSENPNEEEMLLLTENMEIKREGSVNWSVYFSYLRAGAGLIFGIFFMIFIFGIREASTVYYSWWLAKWSDDESYRYRTFNNCTNMTNHKILLIQSMNDTQWENYRNERFYFYCG